MSDIGHRLDASQAPPGAYAGSVPRMAIVVPCYNEEEALPETVRQLDALLDRMIEAGRIDAGSGVYLVDDGSRDATWAQIEALARARGERWHGIKLSRNRGHQNALLAGLHTAEGDVVVSIDADLQDDIEAIPLMLAKYSEGCEIVYGVRDDRSSDTAFKRETALFYYRLLRWLGAEIVPNHADFRLLGRRALEALRGYGEVNLFLRAIVPLLGFRTAIVTYRRTARTAGESKYPLRRMIGLAVNGITSFSMQPLRLITFAGVGVSLLAFLTGFWAIGVGLFSTSAVPGWTSTVVPLAFIGGLQILALGIIGEYVGKIYMEVKRRPQYEIETRI